MAPGFWKKLKDFGKTVWGGIKKVADPILKIAKPIVKTLAPVLPGGAFIERAVDFAEPLVDKYMGPGDSKVSQFAGQIAPHLQRGADQLSRRLSFRR